ncbi:hypothetical protein [Mesorhizobium sp. B2-5-7]|uniref:hypothetical protein n=1 Tax=Mesorhizobium sp. B2-5-7 TaxID=2589923 RepID=UPI00112E8936|nr:hypothetical protein [Mesorhizobium sp. B2-5-7]TPK18059.1 hypothetical protein FJ543_06120 [Mesorhizobium sp. B2-5-7]
MALEVNGARGEVALNVGGVDLVIAATMAGLAAVSTRLECKSLADLFVRLSGVEVAAAQAAIELLTVRGDKMAALAALKLRHFKAIADAFTVALSHHFKDDEGNGDAAPAVAAG